MRSSPHSFSQNPLIWDYFLCNIWHTPTMIKMFPETRNALVDLNRTQEKHLFTLSLHSEGLEEAFSTSNISFFPISIPIQLLNLHSRLGVPVQSSVGFNDIWTWTEPKPWSRFDEASLFLIWWCASGCCHCQRWNSSSSHLRRGLRAGGFHAKSGWIPEFFHYSHPPLL